MSAGRFAALAGALLVCLLAGCANQGSLGGLTQPTALLSASFTMAGPIDENAYYFMALDTLDNHGASFPVPVAAGPFWGNGWGTGTITHYVQYHLGQYNLYKTQMNAVLGGHTGGWQSLTGAAAGAEAGVYTLTVTSVAPGSPPVATVAVTFKAASTGQSTNYNATVFANSSTSTTTPPVPGLTFTTGALAVGDTATVSVQLSPTGILLAPRLFNYTLPAGGNTLSFSFDLGALGADLTNVSFNFITTTQLLFDPSITDPRRHCYDGLGPLGNDAIRTFDPRQFPTLNNATAFVHEGAGDSTLQGTTTQAQRNSVDIVDWSVYIQRLR
ncbi:MAG TPA: hypothetical protein VGM19_04245 [Armatimonadota bacterium]|jgi:hypothetical protein